MVTPDGAQPGEFGADLFEQDADLSCGATPWSAGWPVDGVAHAMLLPYWDETGELPEHQATSYHLAKYKTRRCNGRACRGEAMCCFAHSDSELRVWGPERHSYWTIDTPPGQGISAQALHAGSDWPVTTSDEWRRPNYQRTQPTRQKQRFCASFPTTSQCRRGAACAFAHTREEVRTPLLSIDQEQQATAALTEEFFMYKFKTLWCPIGVQHDWQTCVYAHNYQDARRMVSIAYGPQPCPYWSKKDPNAEYSQRCPLGLRCPFSHGAKEQLYHPRYFRTVICRDLRAKICPRQKLCAFFHRRPERRRPPPDTTQYNLPLKEEALPEQWVSDFLSPPFRDSTSPPMGDSGDMGEGTELDISEQDPETCASLALDGCMPPYWYAAAYELMMNPNAISSYELHAQALAGSPEGSHVEDFTDPDVGFPVVLQPVDGIGVV
mmetsp:Transcript_3148/g.9169  ORF Transcript_3148/g.9169 Transcript_3148/m.9169 type:complete len:436 (-) Transcript_3148:401-1708(-)|eukprot:CAMPEP_0194493802 /NCGR_PEP_ID=MMETSP0253-20130528/11908_1 /TAXON_ID=2966 /ORGANISM="Noctiluca scintillans" /LENGTH=435 /DNA_ID=CAMNT_0039334833 /DNA_START=61 /DNA_END=1368 /DNA_ORIENTATION=+